MSTNTEKTTEILVDPLNFDRSRVVIKDAVRNEFSIGDLPITTTFGDGYYLDEKGNECDLYISLTPQQCFGVSYIHDPALKKEMQTPDNAKGLQICYQMTSIKTINSPTQEEQATIDMMRALWEVAVEKVKEEMEMDDENRRIPAPTINSASAVIIKPENKQNWENVVKIPFDYNLTKDKKSKDKTKPMRMYVKLITQGSGPTLKALTSFFGPGDKKTNPLRYVDVRGIITPCLKWEGVYYGQHGNKATFGASLRFKLVEANFTPQNGSIPNRRMLGKNTSQAIEEDTDDDEMTNGSESRSSTSRPDVSKDVTDFVDPKTDKNSISALEHIAAQNTLKKNKNTQPSTKQVYKQKVNKPVEQVDETQEDSEPDQEPVKPKVQKSKIITKPKVKNIPKPKTIKKKVVVEEEEEKSDEE